MGAAIAAPLSALGTCLGACVGGCVAKGCCALAGSGNVSNAHAARCVMLWLQGLSAAFALFMGATASKWLPQSCDKLPSDFSNLGVCECHSNGDAAACWKDQMVYRTEASVVIVFLVLLLLSVSGCAQGAARSHSVAKFMLVILLSAVALFMPNGWFDAFGTLATFGAAVFLAAQSIFVIDFGYSWSELWFARAAAAQRREIGQSGRKAWLAAILAFAGVLMALSIALCVFLYVNTTAASGHAVNLAAFIIAVVLLIVSILDWCPHGAILCSAVVMFYVMWLVFEAMSVLPDDEGPQCPAWVGLIICGCSLFAFAMGFLRQRGEGGAVAETLAAPLGGAGDTEAGGTAPQRAEEEPQTMGFALQCAVHAAAASYIAAAMAPKQGAFTYVTHVVAVFVALFFYFWSLVAPQVLTSRNFN